MSEALLAFSAISALSSVFAAWHRDRLKDGHNVPVLKAIRIWAGTSLMVVLLAALNQYDTHKQAAALRSAQLRLNVLQSLSSYRVEVLDNYVSLLLHSTTTKNYLAYEASRTSTSAAATIVPNWSAVASDSLRSELNESKAAFDRLQRISREVLMQATTYPTQIPEPLAQWATVTLALKFSDLPSVIDPYHEAPRSVHYAKLTGLAIGAVTGETKNAAEAIAK